MKIIGITGPTGAGKTTALNALTALGARVIDADAVYHELLEESAPMREALLERFGVSILDGRGKIDRKRLGNVVFGDPAALAGLVTAEIERQEEAAAHEGCPAVAIDAIALIESGVAARCDAVVGILAPKELRVERIMAREGISEAYARRRVEAQQGDEFFRAGCTHILVNDGAEEAPAFAERALILFEQILEGD